MADKAIILFCIQKIEETFAHGDSGEWTHHNFVKLSDEIEQKTNVAISETTLKRFFGKRNTDSTYMPQMGTRDALAQYAGFENWQHLSASALNVSSGKNPIPKTSASKRKWYFAVGLLLLFAISGILYQTKHTIPGYQFSIRNNIDTVPFTAIFDYQVEPAAGDTFFIRIDKDEKIPLAPEHRLLTQWFRYSGYFGIELMHNDVVLDTLHLEARNAEWQAGVWYPETKKQFIPFYQKFVDATENDMLYVSPGIVERTDMIPTKTYWTVFRLFKDFETELDNCSLQFSARNNDETGGKPCYDIDIELVGENGHIQTVFTQEKCFRYVKLALSETAFDGRDHDLSFLSTNVQVWNDFAIEVQQQNVSIKINNSEVFNGSYQKTLGALKGIVIRFYGSGQGRHIRLQNAEGSVCFEDDFGEK